MKRNRFISLGAFVIGGIALILSSLFIKNNHTVVSILCFVLAVVVFLPALLDTRVHPNLRVTLLVIGLLFLIASMFGLLIDEENFPTSIYCLIFAILEIINGIAELNEGVEIIKQKNYVMGILFIIDALIEITLGVLMSIERHATLRTHVILISADLFFEGIIKLINEYVEERRGIQKNEKPNSRL